MDTHADFQLTDAMRQAIDAWVAKFPVDQKQSAVIPALNIIQKETKWLSPEILATVADYLDMPHTAVYEVATFYSLYNLKPVGKYRLDLCTNVSCMLCDSQGIKDHISARLGIDFNETSTDGLFTLKEVECLAACDGAPAMYVDGQTHVNLTPEKVDEILNQLEAQA